MFDEILEYFGYFVDNEEKNKFLKENMKVKHIIKE